MCASGETGLDAEGLVLTERGRQHAGEGRPMCGEGAAAELGAAARM